MKSAMPLQTGTWKLNASGVITQFVISGVDGLGNVTGTAISGGPVTGIWDDAAQRLMFINQLSMGVFQVYTGFLFKDQLRMPGVAGSVVFTLVGTFQQFGGNPFGNFFESGWYAQIGVE